MNFSYTPNAYVRTAHSAVKIIEIKWKQGKKTAGQKIENPDFIEAGETCELVFEPQHPFVVDKFENTEGLSRIAIMEGSTVCMIGKCVDVTYDTDIKKKP